MQRIDENTYIDDTLVTCAEYQLFIEEMREQGKYYQPDHWTSHQFSNGQAHKPILGVRQSDALTFCEWLTSREEGPWMYCLPSQEEAAMLPLKPLEQSPTGYWIDGEFQFAWIGDIPEDARGIDFQVALVSTFTRARARAHENVRGRQYDFNLELEIEHARVRALSRPLHLVIPFFDRYANFDHTRNFNHFLIDTLDQVLELSILTKRVQDSAHSVARIRSLTRRLHLERVLGLDIGPNINFDTAFYRNVNYIRILDLYFDTYTLQERIAGRSPTFEGIRIVKERLKSGSGERSV